VHIRSLLTSPPALAALLFLTAVFAVSAGSVSIPAGDTLAIITAKLTGSVPAADPAVTDIIWSLRVPRVLLAMTAGAGLALAGVVMQASVQNPLAEPFILGIASGAMLALSMTCVRKTHQAEPTALFPLMFLVSAGGVLALFAPAILADAQRFFPATPRDIALILVYGIVMQCFAWGLIAYAIPLLSLSLTGLLLLSEPVAALAIDCLLLDKPITTVQWCGAALTLLAIYLGSSKSGAH